MSDAPAAFSYTIDDLDRRFRVTQWIVDAAMLGIGFLIFVTLHETLVGANRYFASLDGPASFVLFPQSAIWFLLPGFAAITLSWQVTLCAWSTLGSGEIARQYEYWSNAKAGFDATRVLRIMAILIVLPIALFTVLALPMHDSLQGSRICSHRYGFAGTETFEYSDARTLAVINGFRTRDGLLTKRAGCVLYFTDGRKWSSARIGDFQPTVDFALLIFLENKTGLRPKYGETEGEIDAHSCNGVGWAAALGFFSKSRKAWVVRAVN